MIEQGNIQGIRDYCEIDELKAYVIYLTFMLHKNGFGLASYNQRLTDVIAMIEVDRIDRPLLGAFLDAWVESSNNQFIM